MNRFFERLFKPPAPFYTLICVPLFYALATVYFVGTRANNSLSAFTSRYIGRATLENFDVGSRISQFYLAILFFIVVFILLYYLIVRFAGKKIISSNELGILNLTSFCGLVLLYTRMLGTEIYPGLRMLLVIHAALFFCIGVRNIYAKQSQTNEHIFTWMVIISFCFLFAVKKVAALFGFKADFSFTFFIWASFAILLVLLRRQIFSAEPAGYTRLMKFFEPLVWLPFLTVIADETYMVLNQRSIFISPVIVFAVLFLVPAAFIYVRANRNLHNPDLEGIIFRRYFPVLITGLSAFVFYSPVQQATSEMFEIANGVLPVQQFYEFGKIPLADTFSSHMLSDFFSMLLYTVFNGYQNLCFHCYDFIFYVIAYIIMYYMLRKITGSGYWAFFIVLFYPYAEHLVPSYVSLALLSVLVLIQSQENRTVKGYLPVFFTGAFLIVWRVDLGFANAIATLATISLVFVSGRQAVNRRALIKAFLWALSAAAVIMLLFFLLRGKNFVSNIQSALEYFSSTQSYGHKELALKYDAIYYSLNYLFPALVLAALGYALYKLFIFDNAKTKMLCLTLCYLSVFYFLNFQRGLVRHGLNEQWDVPLTSFAFLIFMVWVLIIFEKKNTAYLFVATTALMTLVISRYKFPEEELKKGGLYNSVYESKKHFPVIEHAKQKINRMPIAENFAATGCAEIQNFLDKNLSKEESFADFSNTPMLYYYLHKKSPHFFSQSPISYHSENLQKKWIEELEKSNTKMVLFSSHPETWFDVTDGVPNSLRHYIIAEYLFAHFRPGYILNNKTVWLRNEMVIKENNTDTVYSVTEIGMENFSDVTLRDKIFVTGNNIPSLSFDITINTRKDKKYFLTMNAGNTTAGEEKIYFYYNNSREPGKESSWKYSSGKNQVFSIIPVSQGDTITGIRFSLTKNSEFVPQNLRVVECDYVPDYYSTSPRDFSLLQLPYTWGNMDKKFTDTKHKILKQLIENPETISNHTEKKFLFTPLELSASGYYLIIRIGKKSQDKAYVIMNYGEGDIKSGGFTFDLPVSEMTNYVIRISSQYNWYHRPNSWITVYPIGSDIEIEKIQIAAGD